MAATAPTGSRLVTAKAAAALGVSVFTVRHLVRTGDLPAVRFNARSRLRFRPEDVDALVVPSRGGTASAVVEPAASERPASASGCAGLPDPEAA